MSSVFVLDAIPDKCGHEGGDTTVYIQTSLAALEAIKETTKLTPLPLRATYLKNILKISKLLFANTWFFPFANNARGSHVATELILVKMKGGKASWFLGTTQQYKKRKSKVI